MWVEDNSCEFAFNYFIYPVLFRSIFISLSLEIYVPAYFFPHYSFCSFKLLWESKMEEKDGNCQGSDKSFQGGLKCYFS